MKSQIESTDGSNEVIDFLEKKLNNLPFMEEGIADSDQLKREIIEVEDELVDIGLFLFRNYITSKKTGSPLHYLSASLGRENMELIFSKTTKGKVLRWTFMYTNNKFESATFTLEVEDNPNSDIKYSLYTGR